MLYITNANICKPPFNPALANPPLSLDLTPPYTASPRPSPRSKLSHKRGNYYRAEFSSFVLSSLSLESKGDSRLTLRDVKSDRRFLFQGKTTAETPASPTSKTDASSLREKKRIQAWETPTPPSLAKRPPYLSLAYRQLIIQPWRTPPPSPRLPFFLLQKLFHSIFK